MSAESQDVNVPGSGKLIASYIFSVIGAGIGVLAATVANSAPWFWIIILAYGFWALYWGVQIVHQPIKDWYSGLIVFEYGVVNLLLRQLGMWLGMYLLAIPLIGLLVGALGGALWLQLKYARGGRLPTIHGAGLTLAAMVATGLFFKVSTTEPSGIATAPSSSYQQMSQPSVAQPVQSAQATQSSGDAKASVQPKSSKQAATAGTTSKHVMRVCPKDGKTYPATTRFCPIHGVEMQAVEAKFCPKGGEQHPATLKFCPTHGVELRPYVD